MRSSGATSGSQSSLREANSALIVETVQHFGGITQVELAGATGLSTATISTIVKQLLSAGVVETRTTIRSGRRAQLVTLARQTGLAVGLHIGDRHMRIALADVSHEIVGEHILPLPLDHRVDTSLDRAALLIVEMTDGVGASLDEIVGIGVGLPAPVTPDGGTTSVKGMMRGWDEFEIADVLSRRLDKPVFVDNDANLGALAESRFGAARAFQDSIYVRASYGVGSGIVLSGRVRRGPTGTAGEIGHVQVDPQGPICRCGSRGCLNTVVGASALIEALRISRGPLTLRDVVQLALEGDAGCQQVVADAGAAIGAVVASMALAINPEIIVVGGELAETGEILLGPMRDAIRRAVLLNQSTPLEVVPALLGTRAEVRGALALALESAAPVPPLAPDPGEAPSSSTSEQPRLTPYSMKSR